MSKRAGGAVTPVIPLPITKSLCMVTVGGWNAGGKPEYQINITAPSGLPLDSSLASNTRVSA